MKKDLRTLFLLVLLLICLTLIKSESKDKIIKNSKHLEISKSKNYKVILKNVIKNDDGSERGDIYFNINGIDYLAEKDEWIRNWKEFKNINKKLVGCSVGIKGTMEGYCEYWLEKSGKNILIKSYYIGGNRQIEFSQLIKKIKL